MISRCSDTRDRIMNQRVEQRDDDGRHETRLSENIHNLNRRNAYGDFDSRTWPPAPANGRDSHVLRSVSRVAVSFVRILGQYGVRPVEAPLISGIATRRPVGGTGAMRDFTAGFDSPRAESRRRACVSGVLVGRLA